MAGNNLLAGVLNRPWPRGQFKILHLMFNILQSYQILKDSTRLFYNYYQIKLHFWGKVQGLGIGELVTWAVNHSRDADPRKILQ